MIAMEGGGLSTLLTYEARQVNSSGGYRDWQVGGLTWRNCTGADAMYEGKVIDFFVYGGWRCADVIVRC